MLMFCFREGLHQLSFRHYYQNVSNKSQKNGENKRLCSRNPDNLGHTVYGSVGHVKDDMTADQVREKILQDYIQYRQKKSRLQSVIKMPLYKQTSV